MHPDPGPDVEQGPPEREGDLQAAVRLGRRPAAGPAAALPGQGPELRRRQRRRGLDRAVRGARAGSQPLKGQYAMDTSKLLPATVKAATYDGTLFAAPYTSDGGMLYYRKDLVPTPPTDLGRDDRRLHEGDVRHGLLRRSVRQLRGSDRERGRGDQHRRRRLRQGRRQDAERRHSGGEEGPRLPGQRLQAGLHPQGRPSASRRPRASTPSRPASCCSCGSGRTRVAILNTAVQLEGQRQVRHRPAAGSGPRARPARPASVGTAWR